MSDIEAVGLALAVVPIIAALAGQKLLKQDLLMSDLSYEIEKLGMKLVNFSRELPNVPAETRAKLISTDIREVQDSWRSSEVAEALNGRLCGITDSFNVTLGQILRNLEDVIGLKSLGLRYSHLLSSRESYAKLAAIRNKSTTRSSNNMLLKFRFKFNQGRKFRNIVESITEYNKRLEEIIERSYATLCSEYDGKMRPMRSKTVGSKKQTSVRWALSNTGTSSSGTGVLPATRKKVREFCDTVFQAQNKSLIPRVLLEANELWDVTNEPSDTLKRHQVTKDSIATPLTALLEGQRKFTMKEKLILSVVLAHTVLHFCDTLWLKAWDNGLFEPTPNAQTDAEISTHACPSILALGILLLKIEMHCTIEKRRMAEDLNPKGNVTANTDLFIAKRLLPSLTGNRPIKHLMVIDACLNCNFYNQRTVVPNLDNETFRRQVYVEIVRPLEALLYQGFEITPMQLYAMAP
ncbi:hypothetical protein P171DRAFT_489358 [Karstenula rhodostoma CBS 690.94]|uniref:DUF7580 domain-containing protein n=1 Tax=Karstenula rhodostoma CBS 690.94 TaxID=1392251 RepID=A0A9P4U933_9PLEO|nr:hypothetical protein P171DRAFT_489358 [Karstenula rhodostoma CBS 690.94]